MSKIDVPIIGEVKVLLVKVCEDPVVTNPTCFISGLVPSFAVANKTMSPLSVAEKVKEFPEPVAYLN